MLLNFSPYVGETYDVKPGDFSGFALDLEVAPWRGPAWGTWLTDGSAEEAVMLKQIAKLGVSEELWSDLAGRLPDDLENMLSLIGERT